MVHQFDWSDPTNMFKGHDILGIELPSWQDIPTPYEVFLEPVVETGTDIYENVTDTAGDVYAGAKAEAKGAILWGVGLGALYLLLK